MPAEPKQMDATASQDALQSLGDLLRQRAAQAPDKHFLFSETDGRKFSYTEFESAVDRVSCMLAARGVRKGDVVSLLMPNSAEYIIAYFACWKLGAIAGPINSLLKAQEISYVISDSETRTLLVHPDSLPTIETIKSGLPGLREIITFDDEAAATRDFNGDASAASSTDPGLSEMNSS